MSKEITNVSVDIVKVHPRNTEFFDDISGEEYERFKRSIQEDGVLSPILVSPDMTIISGHQRTKAAKELGIKLVPVIIREDLTEENAKLKVLLAANFGRTKNDPVKQRKVAVEYVNLCGLKNGERADLVDSRLPLKEIASQLNTSETSLKELLLIERKLTPEVKQLLDDGIFTKRVASKVLVKLSVEEQEELISTLDVTKKYTQNQIQGYVDKLKEKENEIEELKSQPKEKEVIDNTDYYTINQLKKQIENLQKDKNILEKKVDLNEDEANKFKKLKSDIEFLTQQKSVLSRKITSATELAGLTVELQNVLENKLAPIKFKRCIETLETSDVAVQNLEEVISLVDTWSREMKQILYKDKYVDVVDIQ